MSACFAAPACRLAYILRPIGRGAKIRAQADAARISRICHRVARGSEYHWGRGSCGRAGKLAAPVRPGHQAKHRFVRAILSFRYNFKVVRRAQPQQYYACWN